MALNSAISAVKYPPSDLYHDVTSLCYKLWQADWDQHTGSKLHSVKPHLGYDPLSSLSRLPCKTFHHHSVVSGWWACVGLVGLLHTSPPPEPLQPQPARRPSRRALQMTMWALQIQPRPAPGAPPVHHMYACTHACTHTRTHTVLFCIYLFIHLLATVRKTVYKLYTEVTKSSK